MPHAAADVDAFAEAVEESAELRTVLENPEIDSHAKSGVTGALAADAQPLFANFLQVLVDRGRIRELLEIADAFRERVARAEARLDVEAITAMPLPDDLRARIVESLQDQTGTTVELTESVDPDVVGGLVLRVGEVVVDGSVRRRIEELRRDLTAASVDAAVAPPDPTHAPDLSREGCPQKMKLRPDEITKVLRDQIESYSGTVDVEEVGTVLQVGDGIARVHGLDSCVAARDARVAPRRVGLALNLEEDNVGIVLLGDDTLIKEGDTVRRTGKVIQVPVGEALLGRVVDPLGNPLDDRGPIETTDFRPVEFKAPA